MQPVPIYDKDGVAVAWYEETMIDIIYDLAGHRIAFIIGFFIFDFRGTQRGQIQSRNFCDADGSPVGFVEGAIGGPPKPELRAAPVPPAQFDSDSHFPPLTTSVAASLKQTWSTKTWAMFLPPND
ncbi:4-fold beta flower protein [Fimbriiglobus ruber]|uniref:4-fold beta flower domain-containing protein n=1 Tax=Fimbriiglobus ruber TaxID=1908690 RepID=A0A225DC61_9BACT|nr:hypothetical protein [Fimbriiglobus ruber]OWK39072.1 hypothetical protein FRUB_06154 [Fimbriiglobus ruber]